MISLGKFLSLAPLSQVRKVQRWLHLLLHRRSFDDPSMPDRAALELCIARAISQGLWDNLLSTTLLTELSKLLGVLGNEVDTIDPWQLHRIGLLFGRELGTEAAEWDLEPGSRPSLGTSPGLMVYCEDLRSPFNVGSVFRTAEAFGFSKVLLSQASPYPGMSPRLDKSAMGACSRIDWERTTLDDALQTWPDLPIFALELGGSTLTDFVFPDRGIVILGSEELGVHPQTLTRCRSSAGVVSIPLWGTKASLNVAVSFGILAQSWTQALQA